MTKESELLIAALGWAVTGKNKELSLSADWEALLKLAKGHMLLPLLYDGLQKAGVWAQVPKDGANTLEKACIQAVCQDAQMEHYRQTLEARRRKKRFPMFF